MTVAQKVAIELTIIAISLPMLAAALSALSAIGYVLYKVAPHV